MSFPTGLAPRLARWIVTVFGLDVHQATTVAAVLDGSGKLVMQAIIETKASTVVEFIRGIAGEVSVTLEEGTCAAWLHDLLLPLAVP